MDWIRFLVYRPIYGILPINPILCKDRHACNIGIQTGGRNIFVILAPPLPPLYLFALGVNDVHTNKRNNATIRFLILQTSSLSL